MFGEVKMIREAKEQNGEDNEDEEEKGDTVNDITMFNE